MEKKEGIGNEEIEEDKEVEDLTENLNEENNEVVLNELKAKNKEIAELTDRLLRLQADFMNYKNRVEKERENIYSYANENLMNHILPVLDNFQRAMENAESDNGFHQGVQMIYNQLLEALNANGLKEIECLGEAFDPNFHHAVFMEEVEGTEEGTVLEVLQKGYMLKDKVIRPSMVKVAK